MGVPRTEGAVHNWRDCLGAASRPAPRVAYRNRCRRLQPPVTRQHFCPPPQKKPGLARKYGRGEKSATWIRHAGKYRVSLGCPRWRRPRIQQYKHDSLQRLFPPPKDPHLDSRYLGPWFPQPRALFFFTARIGRRDWERITGFHRNRKLTNTPLAGYLITPMLGSARDGPL
jgi:hypothetical protein